MLAHQRFGVTAKQNGKKGKEKVKKGTGEVLPDLCTGTASSEHEGHFQVIRDRVKAYQTAFI